MYQPYVMKPYFILLLFVFFIPITLLAQSPGYVIQRNNDTIRCHVKNAMFGGAKYKSSDGFQKISIDNIREYQLTKDSSIHEAINLKDGADPEFVLVLERGKICLYVQYIYTYTGTTSTTTTNWYAIKNNAPAVMIKTNGLNLFGPDHNDRKNEFFNLIKDDSKIASAYTAENSFSFNTIRKYIQQYNQAASSQKK